MCELFLFLHVQFISTSFANAYYIAESGQDKTSLVITNAYLKSVDPQDGAHMHTSKQWRKNHEAIQTGIL